MHAIDNTDERCQLKVKNNGARFELMHKIGMAQDITASIRILLHNGTENDSALRALENLRCVTGTRTIAVFQKKMSGDGQIYFDWRYLVERTESGRAQVAASELESYQPASDMVTKLIAGQPFLSRLNAAVAHERLLPGIENANSWLILPITVLGEWWGGLCLGCDDTERCVDEIIFSALGTAVDMLGIYFERQIASCEHVESDRLAGALEMAGTVCHKLNQPMQVILGYASMVTSGDISEPAQVLEIVKLIEDETRRMGIITKNLMGITKYRTVEAPDIGLMCNIDSPPDPN